MTQSTKVLHLKYCKQCQTKPIDKDKELCLECWGKPIRLAFKLAGLYKPKPKPKKEGKLIRYDHSQTSYM